jgi:hypothetical protein
MSIAIEKLNSIQEIISGQNLQEFVDMYDNLKNLDKERVVRLLQKSLNNAQQGYGEISKTYSNLRSYIRFQEDLLDLIDHPVEKSVLIEEDDASETNTDFLEYGNSNKIEEFEGDETFDNITDNENDEDNDNDNDNEDEDNEEDLYIEDTTSNNEDEISEQKRERGRASKISELIQHFRLTNKAETEEEEKKRIKNLVNYNDWENISDERTPHYIIMNATYLASIQFLEANSKNANYSVLTRVMLNPSGKYFEGESVVIRNRYLEDRQEAMEYMQRQMDKIQKQFFYEKSPIIIPNHGNKNSYYGFYLSRENRKSYKDVLQELEA